MTSIASVMRMMFGPAAKEKTVALFGAFFDDSGTHQGSPVTVIGGLLGNEMQWENFAPAWEAQVAEPLPGKPRLEKGFHLTDCRAGKGEFASYNQAERDRITYLFRQIILRHQLVSFAAVVNRKAWDEIVTGKLAAALGDPLQMCFVKCVDMVIDILRTNHISEGVFFFFDQGTKSELKKWADLYVSQNERYPEIDGMAFAPVGKLVPLQGADMIATESYQYAQQWLKDGADAKANAHFREFLRRDLSAGVIVDREMIEESISKLRANDPSLDA
jgi:hypothetical protein